LPAVEPGAPFMASVSAGGRALDGVAFVLLDSAGNLLAAVNPRDCLPPTASLEPLPPWVETTAFTVTWTGKDTWSGVAAYDVQVRDGYASGGEDEGAWTAWMTATTATSGTFTGTHGHTYFFRARARDEADNWGSFGDEEWGQAFTTVLTEPAPVLITSRKVAAPRRFRSDQTVAYTIVVSNTGNLTAAAVVTDTVPAEMAVLTGTLSATSGPLPTYADGQVRWGGTVAAGAQVRVTYALSPTAATPFGVGLTNTVKISGSVLGPLTRRETVVQMVPVWLPLVVREWGP
jgi:uncharacterized repeat protein (TIGR01451 family)